jgi:hypothetical protein
MYSRMQIEHVPAVQPDPPWLARAVASVSRERAILALPGPEEQGVVGEARSVHSDVDSPATSERERSIRKRLRDLEVCVPARQPCPKKAFQNVHDCHAGE